jgi:hypothetical protein
MDGESPYRGIRTQNFQEFRGMGMVGEDWEPAVAAEGYEIELPAQI